MKPAVSVDLPLACYTIDQVAAICQVKRAKVVEWTHRPGFPVKREDRTIRIPVRAFLEWLDKTALETNEHPSARDLMTLPVLSRSGRRQLSGSSTH